MKLAATIAVAISFCTTALLFTMATSWAHGQNEPFAGSSSKVSELAKPQPQPLIDREKGLIHFVSRWGTPFTLPLAERRGRPGEPDFLAYFADKNRSGIIYLVTTKSQKQPMPLYYQELDLDSFAYKHFNWALAGIFAAAAVIGALSAVSLNRKIDRTEAEMLERERQEFERTRAGAHAPQQQVL
jgi:hypothetical protein